MHVRAPSQVLADLRERTPYVAVFAPRRAHPFAIALERMLKEYGFAAYLLEMGASPVDVWRAARATQPESGAVFVEYAPGDYQVLALLLGVLRWRSRGAAVVLCRRADRFRSPRQRIAYALVRLLARAELRVDADDPMRTIVSWRRDRMPARAPLARGWVVRSDRARVLDIVGILRCPSCGGPLRPSAEGLACERCARMHPIVDGIPILLPEGARAQVDEHEHAYQAGDAYELGKDENRAWLEIGLAKRDLVGRLLHGHTARASLDVGCGDWGFHHDVVRGLGSELSVAGDISLKLVRHARMAAAAPGRVHHVVFSAEALPFRDGVFDLAYCSEVLEHVDRPDHALAEIARVGRGGRVILTAPNEEVTGKLEEGHVQTFGYSSFLALVRQHVDVRDVRGVFLYEREPRLTYEARWRRLPVGPLRFRLALLRGERDPRRSLSILVDGILR